MKKTKFKNFISANKPIILPVSLLLLFSAGLGTYTYVSNNVDAVAQFQKIKNKGSDALSSKVSVDSIVKNLPYAEDIISGYTKAVVENEDLTIDEYVEESFGVETFMLFRKGLIPSQYLEKKDNDLIVLIGNNFLKEDKTFVSPNSYKSTNDYIKSLGVLDVNTRYLEDDFVSSSLNMSDTQVYSNTSDFIKSSLFNLQGVFIIPPVDMNALSYAYYNSIYPNHLTEDMDEETITGWLQKEYDESKIPLIRIKIVLNKKAKISEIKKEISEFKVNDVQGLQYLNSDNYFTNSSAYLFNTDEDTEFQKNSVIYLDLIVTPEMAIKNNDNNTFRYNDVNITLKKQSFIDTSDISLYNMKVND